MAPADIKEVNEKRDEEAPPFVGTSACDGCKRTTVPSHCWKECR